MKLADVPIYIYIDTHYIIVHNYCGNFRVNIHCPNNCSLKYTQCVTNNTIKTVLVISILSSNVEKLYMYTCYKKTSY